MMCYRLCILFIFTLFGTSFSGAQNISIGFYNAENLFDTIPSPLYDDGDYTPAGRHRWDTERYRNKLSAVARVVDDMGLDILGLAEVENEDVVRDLVTALSTDYNYIFRPISNTGGRNLALLYKGDKLVPERVQTVATGTSRRLLHVRGVICGRRTDIVVCHLPSLLNPRAYRRRALDRAYALADSLCRADSSTRLVVMGDFNMTPADAAFRDTFGRAGSPVSCPLEEHAHDGSGSYAFADRWLLYDLVLPDTRLRHLRSGIFVRPYMLGGGGKRRGYPLRTFTGRHYTGGSSDHLPVYTILRIGDSHAACECD